MSSDRPLPITKRDLVVYMVVMCSGALVVAVAAWFIAGAFGIDGQDRMLVAGQTPVLLTLLLWLLVLCFPEGKGQR